MKNYRKLILGLAYLLVCALVSFWHITRVGIPFDGLGLAGMFAGLATGVGAVIYGNVKEHQSKKTDI